jgi:hypothetical protein
MAPEPTRPAPQLVVRERAKNPGVARRRARRRSKPSAVRRATDTAEMLRIEYQTSDPNVRIIWFVPPPNGASTVNERSAD